MAGSGRSLLVGNGSEGRSQSATRAPPDARSRRAESGVTSDTTPSLDCAWRIHFRRGTAIPMMQHLVFMARLWAARVRAAVREFKISRRSRRSNARYRVVERGSSVHKSQLRRRRHFPSNYGHHTSARYIHLKRSFRRGSVPSNNSVVGQGLLNSPAHATASWDLISFEGLSGDAESEISVSSITPISWATRWEEIEFAESSPQVP